MKKILLLSLLVAGGVQNNYAMENNNRIIDMINFPLHEAIINGNAAAVQELIDDGYDVNTLDRFGDTALSEAAAHRHIDIVLMLLDAGADLNLGNETPLYIAAGNGHIDIIQILIDAGADLNSVNHLNQTPLYFAIYNNQVPIASLLITEGADVNLGNYESNTPLHFATRRNNIDLVRQLICAGADANIRNVNNESALDVARLLAPRDTTATEQRNRQASINLLANLSRTNRVAG